MRDFSVIETVIFRSFSTKYILTDSGIMYTYVKGNIHPGRIAYIFKVGLTWSPFTYSMTLDAYHIDSVNTCYD